MKQIPAPLLTLVGGVLITLISLWVGQNHGLLPEQASAQAPLVDSLFDVMVTIATALFIVVEGTIVYFAIQFRKRRGDEEDGLPIEGNLPLEAFWTAIPAVIVIGLGIYSVAVFQEMGGISPAHQHGMQFSDASQVALVAQAPSGDGAIAEDVSAPLLAQAGEETQAAALNRVKYGFGASPEMGDRTPDLTVNVTGMQYAWLFNYPDTGIIAGELHVPVDTDVQINLSAQDVIHSFWVPQFRLKQDAIPGQETQLRFVATKPGTYPVICAELCGAYHGGMRSQVIVHTPEEFTQWLADNRVATDPQAAEEAIATNTQNLSDTEYLAPYDQDLGVDTASLTHLHAHAMN
ncbi:MAG: cytochrome c oxidase subunit II [Elainellaceae cyanobacterium]